MHAFRQGISHGIPIALGYFSVSIGFGLLAVTEGLSVVQAVLLSMLNLTSAGQLAGVRVMASGGALMEMGISQLFINLRYALMSTALSQKLDDKIGIPARLGVAFFVTDEIFAVSSSQPGPLQMRYLGGLVLLPYFAWAGGTFVGALAGKILPDIIRNGLGLAIYGMFLAIIVPPSRESTPIRHAVLLAICLRLLLAFLPGLSAIPSGFAIVATALTASAVCAFRYPLREET